MAIFRLIRRALYKDKGSNQKGKFDGIFFTVV